jgi:hypothetical protein
MSDKLLQKDHGDERNMSSLYRDQQQKDRRNRNCTQSKDSAETQIHSLDSTALATGGSQFHLCAGNTAPRTSSSQETLRQAESASEAEAQRRVSVGERNLDF